jgi:transposase
MSKETDWPARVEAWRTSGMSAGEFCKGREYSATTLYWWSSQLKRADARAQRGQRMPLARVVQKAEKRPLAKSSSIVVQIGQARVEVTADVDRNTLSVVLEALARAPWEGKR